MSKDDLVELVHGDSSVTVHLFGATITSWKTGGNEMIFVSSKAIFDNAKAIRGGIPLVFPHFGPWKLGPQHGFARITKWTLESPPRENEDRDIEAVFSLSDSESTRSLWNHKFKILYTVILQESSLVTRIEIANTGTDNFSFMCLLHTYLHVPDVTQSLITSLGGCLYIDKVKNGESFTESRFHVSVAESTDRVYQNTSSEHLVTNCAGGNNVKITKENFPDTVIWNPWKENAKKMADFGDDEYPKMLCVEPGYVSEPVMLSPNEIFSASQKLEVVSALK